MSYSARVFRVLIASPSDVTEEREIAVRTIQEWNDLNSAERQVVLLPLRWETHSAPEYGRRPQEVLNRQIVDHADLLVCIFWTRVGSPTGTAESGSIEEIERVATRGKPVMLYFSSTKQEPDRIDLEQLRKLRDFKAKTFPKALVETFSTQVEFRDKLTRQLEIQLRTLLAAEGQESDSDFNGRLITDIDFAFADPDTGGYLGPDLDLATTIIDLRDADQIPDFRDDPIKVQSTTNNYSYLLKQTNKDYYRELVEYVTRQSFIRPLRFWLKNVGAVGARDVYVDLTFSSESGELELGPLRRSDLRPPSKWGGYADYTFALSTPVATEELPSAADWSPHLELQALQPKREVSPDTRIVAGLRKGGLVTVEAKIYADSLPEPLSRRLSINWKVDQSAVDAKSLLESIQGASSGG